VAHRREFSPFVKVAVIFTMVTVALLVGYPLAIFKLAEQKQPLSRSVVIATFFVAMTLVFCIEFLIYGLAMTLAARWRRVPAPQFDETAR
jgi:RsiW-degrading membrane proteinase PrsW (M82 family)